MLNSNSYQCVTRRIMHSTLFRFLQKYSEQNSLAEKTWSGRLETFKRKLCSSLRSLIYPRCSGCRSGRVVGKPTGTHDLGPSVRLDECLSLVVVNPDHPVPLALLVF
jgi:hypothetical protein